MLWAYGVILSFLFAFAKGVAQKEVAPNEPDALEGAPEWALRRKMRSHDNCGTLIVMYMPGELGGKCQEEFV